ncbi:hypothetical protein CA13_40670 [Planctomycetes bacterium CA13]|uniref:Uncharacterized protein n=1 Tax=Novipirellula herctigrandis TaxID=2527986 RepID=A0A5C5Z5T3_9BACT|nr:hypothetical protein CA13_40670 [Planctomycetes bacterium CA13]
MHFPVGQTDVIGNNGLLIPSTMQLFGVSSWLKPPSLVTNIVPLFR